MAIGDLSQTQKEKLTAMHETVKGVTDCELLMVEPGGNLSDIIFTSKIIGAESAMNNNQQMLNEENDPELMMALQLSLQEEQAREAAMNGVRGNPNGNLP